MEKVVNSKLAKWDQFVVVYPQNARLHFIIQITYNHN